jgi:hypothetical protein
MIFSLLLTVMLAYLMITSLFTYERTAERSGEDFGFEGLSNNAVLYLQGAGRNVSVFINTGILG